MHPTRAVVRARVPGVPELAKGETAGDIAAPFTEREDREHLPYPPHGKMGLSSNSDLTYYALKNQLID